MKDCAVVLRPEIQKGQRIIAVSDIHGNLPFFQGLMEKIELQTDDVLILVGDILEKGRDSLALLRYLMELSTVHTIYPICGNCDGLVLRFFESDALDEKFFAHYLPKHPESTIRQMADEISYSEWRDFPGLREALRQQFPDIWAWLKSMPTIVETEHCVFVHGGVPSLSNMEQLDRWHCMKNDDFRSQGHTFEKYVVVGHWPVTLYHSDIQSSAPIFDWKEKIISIDGGCVLKADGQLNALMLNYGDVGSFSWVSYDGLPVYRALDAQRDSPFPLNIRWGRSELELLQLGEELSLCKHKETGRTISILNAYLRDSDGKLWCEDSTDYLLPVQVGDRLSLVAQTKQGYLMKKDGVTGWYHGRIAPDQ